MNPLAIKLLIGLAIIAASFGAGWRVSSAFTAERDLAIKEAKIAMLDAYRNSEAGSARVLEAKLADLKANERVIEREKLKIIDRPAYRMECLDSDGLQLLERARAGTGKADPAKPADEVRPAQ